MSKKTDIVHRRVASRKSSEKQILTKKMEFKVTNRHPAHVETQPMILCEPPRDQ